jgi:HK97 family phage major capsid protein
MDVERILRLKQDKQKKIAQARDILDRCELEKRELSRREAAEHDRLIGEIDDLDGQIRRAGGSFDPRQHLGDSRVDDVDGNAVALGPKQRMQDWAAARGHGLSAELEEFSLGKAIRGAVTGRWEGAALEHRALAEGSDSLGGYLIPEPLSARLIDRIRHVSRVFEMGVTLVPMTVDELSLARLITPGSASWKAENDPVDESDDLTFDRVKLEAKTLPILARMSRELFDDMSPEAAALIERELLSVLALELDRVVLRGSGSDPEPKGILNQTSVTVTELGSGNGAELQGYDELIDAIVAIREAGLEPNGILYAPRTGGHFDKLKLSTGEAYPIPPSVQAIPRRTSRQVPIDATVGSSTDCSEAYVADWSQVLVGMRTDIRVGLQVLKERYADNLQVGLLGYLRADVQIAHPEGCAVVTGIRPTS